MHSKYWVFCEIVETGSFTAAARKIGYSQSAVSQIVKTIENEIGSALIERKKDGISLTRDGEEFLPYFQALKSAEEALERKRMEMEGMASTTIHIGAFTSVSRSFLPGLISRFKARYPDVRFMIKQGDYTSIPVWINEGSVDFGFISLDALQSDNIQLENHELYRDNLMAVMPKNHPLAGKKAISLYELRKEPLILLDEGSFSTTLNAFAAENISIEPTYRVFDDYTIISMVSQGLGVSLLYSLVVMGHEDDVAIVPIIEKPSRHVGLVWKNWDTMPYASRKFAQDIMDTDMHFSES